MPLAPKGARYICPCGQDCGYENVKSWIYVTCYNKDCPEYNIRQLATWKKHKIILPSEGR